MGTLTGKTALVTGAGRGIGSGIAERLAADGARVGVHYNSSEKAAKEVQARIEASGGSAFTVQGELGVPNDARNLWSAFDEHADGVDILVNNAGAMLFASLSETSEEEYDHQQAVNAKSVFFLIKYGLERFRDGGRIINLSTFFLRIASPQAIAYNVSKAMVDIITPALAWELGPRNITVNAISPGYVETDMTAWIEATGSRDWVHSNTPNGRLGTPSDIADVAAFLASHDGRWVNGQVLEASGGAHLAAPQG